jgi:chromosome segregation ATPase
MPVGVPEADVFAAADRVLARGERPTVERVRVELGRGSPARVGLLLETWWDALAKRLAGHAALPDLPPEVAAAFAQIWQTAVTYGRAHAEAMVAPERAALAEVVAKADASVAEHQRAREAAETATKQAWVRNEGLTAHSTEQQTRLQEKDRQLAAAAQAYASLEARLGRAETALAEAERARTEERVAAAREREAMQAHVRQIEDRAAREIDRAREELKALQRELIARNRALELATRTQTAAQTALHKVETRAAAAEARATALAARIPVPRSTTRAARSTTKSKARSATQPRTARPRTT